MSLIFIDLSKGRILLKPQDGEPARAFDPKAPEDIGDYLAKRPGFEFISSSSVHNPEENGFPRNFDAKPIMAKAVEHAFRKLALIIEPGPLHLAAQVIECAAKAYPHPGPVPFLLPRSGRKGEDVLLTFQRDDLEIFLSGIRYSANLTKPATPEKDA